MSNKTSPWVWVGVGCGVAIFGILAFVGVVLGVAFTALRSTDPYRDGLARATNDPRVVAALGSPLKAGWLVSGSIDTKPHSATADLRIPISGPKGSGTVHVVGTMEHTRWTYTRMTVTPDKGEPIDLLSPPG